MLALVQVSRAMLLNKRNRIFCREVNDVIYILLYLRNFFIFLNWTNSRRTRLCHIFFYLFFFFNWPLILFIYLFFLYYPIGLEKIWIGNLKSFKIMSLHQTDIRTQRRKKNSIFPYFSFFFNRLNIIQSTI